MAYGAMGGDGQPQTQSALFTRHVISGEPLAEAIDRPRWVLGGPGAIEQAKLRLESRFDGNLVDQLAAAGHDLDVLPDPYSDIMGHAGAAVLHADGTCEGAHDPRGDGGAAGCKALSLVSSPHSAFKSAPAVGAAHRDDTLRGGR